MTWLTLYEIVVSKRKAAGLRASQRNEAAGDLFVEAELWEALRGVGQPWLPDILATLQPSASHCCCIITGIELIHHQFLNLCHVLKSATEVERATKLNCHLRVQEVPDENCKNRRKKGAPKGHLHADTYPSGYDERVTRTGKSPCLKTFKRVNHHYHLFQRAMVSRPNC